MADAILTSAIQHYDTSVYAIGDCVNNDLPAEVDSILVRRTLDSSKKVDNQYEAVQHVLPVNLNQLPESSSENGMEQNHVNAYEANSDISILCDTPPQGTRNASASGEGQLDVSMQSRRSVLKSCLTPGRGVGQKRIVSDRHVRFPEDGSLVTGAMSPVDPWRAAHVCSPEELVNSYRLACESQSIRANPFIEEQLKAVAVRDVADRHGGLCLKNIKLDTCHCEALEQVLRRVRFVTLDLENTQLEDDAACMLFDMVEFYESAIRLSLAHNVKLSLRGWLACARMLKMTHSLEYLDVRHCVFNEHTITVLARALKLVAHLTVLHLEHAAVSGRVLATLVAALRLNESVREVYLSDSRLMPSDGVHISALLKFNRTLQLLDLRNNALQDVGLMHICEGLAEQTGETGLCTLILWNNQITHYSMAAFGRALAQSKCLESVNVGSNNITNEGVHQLKEGLLKNKSLLHFGLKASKIGCEGAVALAEYIAESSQLQRIDLRGNDIRTGGLMALSLALRVNRTMQQLDLDREPKREPGVQDFAQTQKKLLDAIGEYTERNMQIVKLKEEVKQLLERQAESVKQTAEQAAAKDNEHSPSELDVAQSEDGSAQESHSETLEEPVDIGVGAEKMTHVDDPICSAIAQESEIETEIETRPSNASGTNDDDDEEEEAGPDEQIVVLAEQVTGNEMTKATLERRRLSNCSSFDSDVAQSSDTSGLSAPVLGGHQLSPRNSVLLTSTPKLASTPNAASISTLMQVSATEQPLTATDLTEINISPSPSPSPSPSNTPTSTPQIPVSFTLPASPAPSPTTKVVRNRFSVSLVSSDELGVSRAHLREIAAAAKSQRANSVSMSEDSDTPSDSETLRIPDYVTGGVRARSLSASVDS